MGKKLHLSEDKRNPAAVALSKLGASKGGLARAASLSVRKRKMIASKAARARWGAKKNDPSVASVLKRMKRQNEQKLERDKVRQQKQPKVHRPPVVEFDHYAELPGAPNIVDVFDSAWGRRGDRILTFEFNGYKVTIEPTQ